MNRLGLILFFVVAAYQGFAQAQKADTPAGSRQAAGTAGEDCLCESGPLPEVLALVNGVKITAQEVSGPIEAKVAELKRHVTDMRNRSLYLQINSMLLDAEAAKRGVSAGRILQEEVMAKVQEPTEAEAKAHYEKNKGGISGEYEAVKDSIVGWLRNQRQDEETRKLIERLRAAADIKVLSEKVTVPSNEAERARILATVNGKPITSGDIEVAMRPLIFNVQEQLYALRKASLDQKINTALLEHEAQKRKVSPEGLLTAEVTPKVKKVTAADARKFYEQNKNRIEGDTYEQLESQIIQYVQSQERQKEEEAFAARLREAASLEILLRAPEPPVFAIATDDQPSRGRADAPVTILEFTDYECSSCAGEQPVLEKLAEEYGGKLRIVVRDYPLAQHAHARKAAEAAEAARRQGKYWEYSAVLYAEQANLGVDKLKEYASQVGLDRKEFDTALDSGRYADQVERDRQDGLKLGVNSTPTVFVNGKLARDRSYESLKAAIEEALGKAANSTTVAKAAQ